jgi:hypothetical protein
MQDPLKGYWDFWFENTPSGNPARVAYVPTLNGFLAYKSLVLT